MPSLSPGDELDERGQTRMLIVRLPTAINQHFYYILQICRTVVPFHYLLAQIKEMNPKSAVKKYIPPPPKYSTDM